MNRKKVEILLSTYNGERYLPVLLDSLLGQTFEDWTLTVRDDGSTDGTVKILKDFASENKGRVTFVEDGRSNLGSCRSFGLLLERATAPYVMFCDQDDLWLPEKIEATLERMIGAEGGDSERPLLVHTDMAVVDESMKRIADSFWRYQNLRPEMKDLRSLLILNNVTGCTVMANRALVRLATPVPQEAIIHDWWLALVAAGLGRIEYIERPTILYRQHGRNVKGARAYSAGYFLSRLSTLDRTASLLRRIVAQAEAFMRIYGKRLPERQYRAARSFSLLLRQGRIRRVSAVLRHGFRGCGFMRNLGVFLLWMSMAPEKDGPAARGPL